MITGGYEILALTAVGLTAIVGGTLVCASWRARVASDTHAGAGDSTTQHESRRQLLALVVSLVGLLAVLSGAAWLLVLQDSVSQWEGVRCLTGVLRLGEGSTGATAWLPGLASATGWLHAALILVAGQAVVLHLAARDERMGPLGLRHRAVLVSAGALAVACGIVEFSYLFIPRTAEWLAVGCCSTTAAVLADASFPASTSAWQSGAPAAYAVAPLACVLVLVTGTSSRPRGRRLLDLAGVVVSFGLLLATLAFATHLLSPARLGLPLHHCLPCLVADSPWTLVGIGLAALAVLATCWRAGVRWIGAATGEPPAILGALDRAALFGVLGTSVFFALEWGLT